MLFYLKRIYLESPSFITRSNRFFATGKEILSNDVDLAIRTNSDKAEQ